MSDTSINIFFHFLRAWDDTERQAELVRLTQGRPLLLPWAHVRDRALPQIVAAAAVCGLIYTLAFAVIDGILPPPPPPEEEEEEKAKMNGNGNGNDDATQNKKQQQQRLRRQLQRRRGCYQITHMVVNALLAAAGFYYNGQTPPHPTAAESIASNHPAASSLGAAQLGYQLWAIPVGLLFVQEDALMLWHHACVIVAASYISFSTNGMRYWAPFFLGCVELSSVPLVGVNIMKQNQALVRRYPRWHLTVRTTFAVLFLWLRVYMFLPRILLNSRDQFVTWWYAVDRHNDNGGSSSGVLWFQIFGASVFASSWFLTFLQLHWGFLVVKGFVKVYSGVFKKLLGGGSTKPKRA